MNWTGPNDAPFSTKNERLEMLSDKIRNGEPVGISEAMEAISYQEHRKTMREKNNFISRVIHKIVKAWKIHTNPPHHR